VDGDGACGTQMLGGERERDDDLGHLVSVSGLRNKHLNGQSHFCTRKKW
jgi:hypothetical protein